LAVVTAEPEQAALSMYRSITSMINQRGGLGAAEQIADALKQVITRYPETEAAVRSSLKQTDLCYLQDETCADSAQQTYRALAEISINRSTREEAFFKEALLYHLTDRNDRAIELLMTMLRNFRSGSVRPHAEALLVRLLPDELHRLLGDRNYIKAIALAQQNRNYFENGWFDSRLLENLGIAYEQLEIYQEALHIFLYLRGVTGVEDKERLYLHLIRISHVKGDNHLVEDFSSEYFYNYPNGLYRDKILFYRTDSLYAQGLVVQALELLPEPLPDTIKYQYLAAAIHYQRNDYVQAIGLLLPIWNNAGTLPEDQLFIMADSLKKLGRSEESRQFFSLTKEIERFRDYSLFQLAGLSSITGNEIQRLSHLQKISDSATNVQMQRLARQEIEFQQLAENL
jgi:tetratricopeptide (TPR) repeat protein